MTPERWNRIQEIFHQGSLRDGDARADYLAQACEDDPDLRAEVEALLASIESDLAADFESAVGRAAVRVVQAQEAGERIGPYRILREIGHGGMGAVYLAERTDEFHQSVALKLVRAGLGNRSALISRFRAERQMLAQLHHPNIATLLDGGVAATGDPYLVMEYIDGVAIDQFVRERKLPVRERVKLMLPVCSAVHYAHQNLIIHRDLKPGNVLVTKEGTPKLLDFGIAKLMSEDDQRLTRASERLLTPLYSSPEQIRGTAVTTATDVYALGVLLYELLTGRTPFDASTLTPYELEVAVCSEQPPSLASFAKIDSDLDVIVLKAMRKEAEHRYSSVSDLLNDLQRYLDGYPVQARRGTWRYTAGKFVRRHRGALVAASLIMVTLLWGGISTYRAQQKAASRFGEVRELANHFLFEFEEAIENLPGATPARALVVQRGLQYLDRLAKESDGDIDLERELARGYGRLREVQYGVRVGHLGDSKGAAESARKASKLLAAVVAARPNDAAAFDDYGYALQTQGVLAYATGHLAEAMPFLEPAARAGERSVQLDPATSSHGIALAITYQFIGKIRRKEGNAKEALAWLNRSLDMHKRLLDKARTPENLGFVANANTEVADVYLNVTGEPAKAIPYYRETERLEEEHVRLKPTDAPARRLRNLARQRIALCLVNMDDRRAALPYFYKNLEESTSALSKDPSSAMQRRGMSVAQINLADTLSHLGQNQEALELFRKAIAIREALYERDRTGVEARDDLSWGLCVFGSALDQAGDHAGARNQLERSADLREKIVLEEPTRIDIQLRLGRTYSALAKHWALTGRCENATAYYDKAYGLFTRLIDQKKMGGTDLQWLRQTDAAIAPCVVAR